VAPPRRGQPQGRGVRLVQREVEGAVVQGSAFVQRGFQPVEGAARGTRVRVHGDGVTDLVDRGDPARLEVIGCAGIRNRTKLFPAGAEREVAASYCAAWARLLDVRLQRLVPVLV